MNNQAQQKLSELVERYGLILYEDPKRLEAMLSDLCGECRLEIHLLVSAVLEKVPESLLEYQTIMPLQVIMSRLAKRLMDHLGLTEKAAHWAVESWGLALGVISHQDIEVTEFRKAQAAPEYEPGSPELKEQEVEIAENGERDEYYADAVKLVAESRNATISMLQRRLRLGWNRTVRIIETMEKEGLIGPSDGIKPREVYIPRR